MSDHRANPILNPNQPRLGHRPAGDAQDTGVPRLWPSLALLLIACGLSPLLGGTSPPLFPTTAAGPTTTGTTAGTTYYVRTDGGSPTQCTGLVDAPYPGSGTAQPCAWDHPFRALQPSGEPGVPGTVRVAGGDTLIIGAGSYRMGYGAPGAEDCSSDYPWDCHMPPVPSGPDPAHPTRILGAGWDSGCTDPPELWGAERAAMVLNLTDSSNVEIGCLEITDHAGCAEDHTGGLACPRDAYPYGDWAPVGLFAEDSANVYLHDLEIHGLAHAGVWAGRLTDWTVEEVRIGANGWVGWDGDIDGDDANTGTLTFRRWRVEWNGCVESYPGEEPIGCWAQSAGGYGDGVGTGPTGGDWVIEDSAFLHNTSDGLDLLYHRLGGTITIRRTIAEGNAGDQIKTTGPTHVENVVAVGNCGYFDGQSFTYNVDNCRAGGSALALTLHPGDLITVVNSTITGQGDCLVIAECAEGETCTGSETVRLRNDIFVGNPEFGGGGDTTCLAWTSLPGDPFAIDHAIITGTKNIPSPCPPGSLCGVSPGLWDASIDSFDPHLLPTSPAIDAGTADGAPADDFDRRPRAGLPDIGAYEHWEPSAWVYLPLILRGWQAGSPQVAGCALFPADNVWNTPVDALPVAPHSDAYIGTIGTDAPLHPDFGSGDWPPGSGSPIGIPYTDVPGSQPLVPVTFDYADESNPVPYPIPPDAPIEGGPDSDGDRHVLLLDRDNCVLCEFFALVNPTPGSFAAAPSPSFDFASLRSGYGGGGQPTASRRGRGVTLVGRASSATVRLPDSNHTQELRTCGR